MSALYNDEKLKQCNQRNEREEKLPRAEASLLLSSSYVRRQWIVLRERYLHRLCLPQAAHRGYIEDAFQGGGPAVYIKNFSVYEEIVGLIRELRFGTLKGDEP